MRDTGKHEFCKENSSRAGGAGMTERIGQRLGNYRLLRLIGKGGFAEVYLGEHLRLNTLAAIKVLLTRLASAEEIESFQQEARVIAKLVHPHIVRVLDFDVEDDIPFLVMDYAPNGTLRQKYPRGTRLTPIEVLPYIKQTAEALHYAHERKLIHRDIKPENLLLGDNQQLLLSDFGIALVAQSSRYQNTQEVVGTIAYMAPEQLQGKPRPASDLYALGIVAYEWLTGERPFHGSFTELYSQQMFVGPDPLRTKVPTISNAVEQVVLTALEKDPKARFGSVRAFANAFEQACQEEALLSAPTQFITPSGPIAQPGAVITPVLPPLQSMSGNMPRPTLPATVVAQPAQTSAATLPIAPASAPTAKRAAQPRRRRTRLWVIAGSLILLLAILAGSIAALHLLSAPSANSQQPGITTGAHITSIQVGTSFDVAHNSLQGASAIFHVDDTVFVVFNVSNIILTARIDITLSENENTIYRAYIYVSASDPEPIRDYYPAISVPDIYQWQLSYDSTPEASLTFQVVA
jgi:serine/threonine protein kinase